MTTKKISTAIVTFAALFALSACQNETTGVVGNSQTNTQTKTEVSTTTTETPNETAGETQAPQQPALTETDQVALDAAMELRDATYCDKISIESAKAECKMLLSDKMAEDDAMQMRDPVLCDKLSTEDKKSACKLKLEVALKAEATNAAPSEEDNVLYAQALDEKNEQKCDQIKNEDLKASCHVNIQKKSQ